MLPELLKIHAMALVLTILIETAFALAVKIRNRTDLIIIILAQVMTNPMVVFVSNWCLFHTSLHPLVYQIPLEIAAVLAEWIIYRKFTRTISEPFLFSLAANLISYTIGWILSLSGFFSWIM